MIMPQLIINTYVSLMYELKKNGKLFTSKSVGTGPLSYEKRIYRTAVSQRLRNAVLRHSQKTRRQMRMNGTSEATLAYRNSRLCLM